MEDFQASLKCAICKNILDTPVLLPCGNSICKKHVSQEMKEYDCPLCADLHQIPAGGFYPIKALEKQLRAHVQCLSIPSEYETALKSVKSFEKQFEELKQFHQDPYFYVEKVIGNLKSETDLMREKLKVSIDEKANEVIKQLEDYLRECKTNLNEPTKFKEIDENVKRMSGLGDKWKQCLATFSSNAREWTLVREESLKEQNQLRSKLAEYQQNVLLRKLNEYEAKVVQFTHIQIISDSKYILFIILKRLMKILLISL
jgi:hypothetical protein